MATDLQMPKDQDPVLRVIPMPADTNAAGDIFGGWLMSQVDLSASVIAARRARGRVATVAVTSFTFRKPVYVADLVSFYAKLVSVGTTSMTVDVTVYAERGWRTSQPGKIELVTEATLVYVAIDANGGKRAVPAEQ
jgi:acyl-CoA thioesterase YciA